MPLERFVALRQRLRALAQSDGAIEQTDSARAALQHVGLSATAVVELFESQLTARHLDRVAYELRARGEGFYTISSAGHEGNVVLGRVLRPTDPALLHYRSGALFIERARAAATEGRAIDAIDAVTLGLTASADDPISGGRHKVFGSVPLCVLPQTSTIASQLPKALGLAFCLERARRLGHTPRIGELPLPKDALVVTSLGDASLNHASAAVALNSARWVAFQRLALPLLIVCEDNGLGLSVRTPDGWPAAALSRDPSLLPYFAADGSDLLAAFEAATAAAARCRRERRPVVLHLRCVRLMGHSGADPDTTYRSREELDATADRDPLLSAARMLVSSGALTHSDLLRLDDDVAARVDDSARRASARPKLSSAAQIMEPLVREQPERVRQEARRSDFVEARSAAHGGDALLPEQQKPQPLSRLINWALFEAMAKYKSALLFGEDVAEKGGVYNLTAGLWKRFGAARVFNTMLDETSILGLAQGAGALGLLPIPEIQYLAFLHNAEDQLRGEAASTSFFSRGQLRSPMVLRIASFGYQKGFGGHFHNDNSIAVLRDIPGLLIATPSNGRDAVGLLRTLFAAAEVEGRVAVFLEPIALYNERDLFERGDGRFACSYPPPGECIDIGDVGVFPAERAALTLMSYGNGVRLCRRAAAALRAQHGIEAEVVDLRWLKPLPLAALVRHARSTRRVLFVDECRQAGNVGEAVIAELACQNAGAALALLTARDSYVPLGEAATLVLPSEAEIVDAALRLCGRSSTAPRD